jgi:hypothetical protein
MVSDDDYGWTEHLTLCDRNTLDDGNSMSHVKMGALFSTAQRPEYESAIVDREQIPKEHNMYKYLLVTAMIVSATFLAPMSIAAAVRPTQASGAKVQVRVFDRSHKDYHTWDDNEDSTYRKYLSDNHKPYHPIAKISRKQQTDYWNFRHADSKK